MDALINSKFNSLLAVKLIKSWNKSMCSYETFLVGEHFRERRGTDCIQQGLLFVFVWRIYKLYGDKRWHLAKSTLI